MIFYLSLCANSSVSHQSVGVAGHQHVTGTSASALCTILTFSSASHESGYGCGIFVNAYSSMHIRGDSERHVQYVVEAGCD